MSPRSTAGRFSPHSRTSITSAWHSGNSSHNAFQSRRGSSRRSNVVCGQLLQHQAQPAVILRRHTQVDSASSRSASPRRRWRPAEFTQARARCRRPRPTATAHGIRSDTASRSSRCRRASPVSCMTGASASGDGMWRESRPPPAADAGRTSIDIRRGCRSVLCAARPSAARQPLHLDQNGPASSRIWRSTLSSVGPKFTQLACRRTARVGGAA